MKQTLQALLVCAGALVLTGAAQGQDIAREMHDRTEALIQQRLDRHRPMRVSADTLTLVGDELRLAGHVRIWFDDMALFTDQAVVHRDTHRVEWSGNTRINLPRDAQPPTPRIEFR
jgi:hypothetical protein